MAKYTQAELERRSQILEWIDADFLVRKPGPPLSEMVGRMLDSGDSLQQAIDRLSRSVKPRRAQRLAERQARADSDRPLETV